MLKLSVNQNELEVLRILWEKGGAAKPAEIQASFGWPIENATLRSVLVNLVAKKHIARELRGKAYFYAARVPKATLLQTLTRHLARAFAGGSEMELVAQLVQTTDITPADLALLQAASSAPNMRAGVCSYGGPSSVASASRRSPLSFARQFSKSLSYLRRFRPRAAALFPPRQRPSARCQTSSPLRFLPRKQL
jgi:predicted transcriptional regulator